MSKAEEYSEEVRAPTQTSEECPLGRRCCRLAEGLAVCTHPALHLQRLRDQLCESRTKNESRKQDLNLAPWGPKGVSSW